MLSSVRYFRTRMYGLPLLCVSVCAILEGRGRDTLLIVWLLFQLRIECIKGLSFQSNDPIELIPRPFLMIPSLPIPLWRQIKRSFPFKGEVSGRESEC